MIGAHIIMMQYKTMDNQVIFGGQINMQNNMPTVHVGIFHLFKKTCWL